ncbi:MAG TPA: hypothetical protein VFA68_00460 [Terriglobales bacterium]|nr:hypothetical protein [Terriglobales bacterium]
MRSKYIVVVLLMLGILHNHARGQDPVPADAALSTTNAPRISAPFVTGTAQFAPELERTNYLDAGFSFGTSFDDNALNTAGDRMSDTTFSMFPNIALRQSRSRMNWRLSYAGGFAVHQRFSSYNQGSHDFGLHTTIRLAPHIDLTLFDRYLMATSLFDQSSQNAGLAPGTILQQPNSSVILPLAKINSNNATVQINDQFSASSALGGSATFYQSHYKDAPVGTSLVDTDSKEAEAYFNHRISARHFLGAIYRFQKFSFSPLANDMTAHSVLAAYTLQLRPTMTLAFFAGPQHTQTMMDVVVPSVVLPRIQILAIAVPQKSWSTTAGGSYVWNGLHTGVTVNASRTLSDGGGLLGAVNLTSVDGTFRRQLSRQYTVSFAANYGQSDAVGQVPTPYSAVTSALGSVSVNRTFATNLGLTLGYARAFQLQGNGQGIPNISHNRAWISVSYQLSRPLGR